MTSSNLESDFQDSIERFERFNDARNALCRSALMSCDASLAAGLVATIELLDLRIRGELDCQVQIVVEMSKTQGVHS